MLSKFPKYLFIGAVASFCVIVAGMFIQVALNPTSAVPEAVRAELGDQAIGLMAHATKVETFTVRNFQGAKSPPPDRVVAAQLITSVGPVEGASYARRLCSIFFDGANYPADPPVREFHPQFAVRMIGPKGTVEIALDLVRHKSYLRAMDDTNDMFHEGWIEDLQPYDGVSRLAHEAFPRPLPDFVPRAK